MNPEDMQFFVLDGLSVQGAAAAFARSLKFSANDSDDNHAEIVAELASMVKNEANNSLEFKRNAYEGLNSIVNANYKICG